jgi:hypothetical protein
MRRRLGGIEGKSILDGAWRVGLAGLGMAVSLLIWIQLSGGWTRWIDTQGGVAIGGADYLAGVRDTRQSRCSPAQLGDIGWQRRTRRVQ